MIASYDWAGGREALLRFGPATGPIVLIASPLFEEANRLRAFTTTLARLLAERGIASALPDLPGTGESLIPTEAATLERWRDAWNAAAITLAAEARAVHGLGLRGGALVDRYAELASRCYLAPMTGVTVVRELMRIWQAADPAADPATMLDDGPPIEIAGNLLSRTLLGELGAAIPAAGERVRVLRLDSDAAPADRKLPGTPLWRRTEPGNDPALAALLADELAQWIAACGA